jgi:hypothetical protein
VGSKSKATQRGCFLFAAGRLYRDRLTRTRETRRGPSRRQELRIGQNKANSSQRNSPLTRTYIIRGEKSPGDQTHSSWFLHVRFDASSRSVMLYVKEVF